MHEGAFGLRQWQRLFGKEKKRAQDFLIWIPPVLLLLLSLFHYLWNFSEEWFQIVWTLIAGVYALGLSFFHLFFGWKAREDFLNRIFYVDFWLGLFLISLLIESILLWTGGQVEVRNPNPLRLSEIGLLGFLWLQLRALEIFLWKKRLKGYFQNPDYHWASPHQPILSLERRLAIAAVFLSLALSFLLTNPPRPSQLLAAILPTLLPWPQWLMTHLMALAEKFKFICQSFSHFLRLRSIDLLAFHQSGVLTSETFTLQELWIDQNDEFTETEIQDALTQLAQNADHPVSEIIQKKSPPTPHLLKLETSETKENLGVIGDFEDLNHRRTAAVLSGLTWHKILQHEISEEGMKKIREWKSKNLGTLFLSLNRKVVAAVVWENLSRPLEATLKSDRPLVLISSQSQMAEGIPSEAFDQVCMGLLPVERKAQNQYWSERASQILEIRAPWDTSSSKDEIVVSDRRSALNDSALGIFKGNALSALFSVEAATRYHHSIRWIIGLMLLASIGGLGLSQGLPIFLILYLVGLLWLK
jgi:hypothetical protein